MTAPEAGILQAACAHLADRDVVLARAYTSVGLPQWRVRAANYETLARIVVYQLISTKAADAIWQRVRARYVDLTPAALSGDDPSALLACGLSGPKLRHLQAIAEAVETGALDLIGLKAAPIEIARQHLLAVRGIGPWTADTFLMTATGQLDAFPHGDVGLMEAYKRLSQAAKRPSSKAFSSLAEAWRPYRAVAAHLLYDWFNQDRAKP